MPMTMRSVSRTGGLLLPVLMACADAAAVQEPTDAYARASSAETAPPPGSEGPAYRFLAARRASTLERELNAAAEAGFRVVTVTWGQDGIVPFPGDRNETMVLLEGQDGPQRFRYRVMYATTEKTLEAALNKAGTEGFLVRAVARRAIILERGEAEEAVPIEYRVVTTTRISTLEAEIAAAAGAGYAPVGIRPPFAIEGLVAILSRPRSDTTPATAP